MNFRIVILTFFVLMCISCSRSEQGEQTEKIHNGKDIKDRKKKPQEEKSVVFKQEFIANKFDFPVGKPDAKGYYNAQKYMVNNHLGDDWNAITGGNSDLGDPIYAIGNGYVKFAKNIGGGWGNVIRIDHKLSNNKMVESLYAHCDSIFVKKGNWVKIGDKIATIGNANGLYFAHLHFEIRENVNMPVGGGYSSNNKGYLDPTEFIQTNRKVTKN